MAVRHVSSNIEGLLGQSAKTLGRLFNMNGKDARQVLINLKHIGHKYIGSEGCTNFDPMKGCRCGEETMEIAVRVPAQKQIN